MQAIGYKKQNGGVKVEIIDAEMPQIGQDEILVKVFSTAITATDTTLKNGNSRIARIVDKLMGSNPIPGDVFAGEIVEIGTKVTTYSVGEKVFGTLAPNTGAHAEFLKIHESKVFTQLPKNVTFVQAAALVDGPLTAYAFLTKSTKLMPGQSVLINGAAGSVGCAAVQIAKHIGAKVTGVCGPDNAEFVRSLGADDVIDYTQQNLTNLTGQFDVIFDTVNKTTFQKTSHLLTPKGIYLTTGPSFDIATAFLKTRFTSKKAQMSATGPFWKKSELESIRNLVESNAIKPIIDSEYDLTDIAKAHARVESGHKRGSVIVNFVK